MHAAIVWPVLEWEGTKILQNLVPIPDVIIILFINN